jgi:hypothetical protein
VREAIPVPYTLRRRNPIKNILDSIKSQQGVKVFSGFREGERKNFKNRMATEGKVRAVPRLLNFEDFSRSKAKTGYFFKNLK